VQPVTDRRGATLTRSGSMIMVCIHICCYKAHSAAPLLQEGGDACARKALASVSPSTAHREVAGRKGGGGLHVPAQAENDSQERGGATQ
jgi:hypothetical protein